MAEAQDDEEMPKADESESESDDADHPTWIRSIRSKTGLETAVEIEWPHSNSKLVLSTRLQPEDIAPMFDGTQWAGTRVWRAAVVATQYLLETFADSSEGTTLLELGCGLGLPGMILHSMRQWKVVLTDRDPLPKQLERNCRTNFQDDYGKSILSHELDWSREAVQELMARRYFDTEKFDVVLNCDCVYEPLYGLSWRPLAESLDELLRIHPQSVVVTCLERRKADGVDDFLETLDRSDHISKVEQIFHQSEFPEVQLFRIYGFEN